MKERPFIDYKQSELDDIKKQAVDYVLMKISNGIKQFRLDNEEEIDGKLPLDYPNEE